MPKRYMKNLRAQFVSLVSKAANRREFLTRKDEDGEADELIQIPIIKRDDLAEDGVRYISGVVYEPGVVDTQGDQMTAVEIEKAAHRYMRDFQGIDVQHSFKPESGCWVAESTVHKSDTVIGGQHVPAGAWTMTVGIENPRIIAKIDSGELNGFSVGGFAQYVTKSDMLPGSGGEEQGMFKQLFMWLGEKLGLLKPADGQPQTQPPALTQSQPMQQAQTAQPMQQLQTAPQAAAARQQTLPQAEPNADANNNFGASQGAPEQNKEDQKKKMDRNTWNELMQSLSTALVQKGALDPEEAPETPPAKQTANLAAADLASVVKSAVASGIEQVLKTEKADATAEPAAAHPESTETVEKADQTSVTLETLTTVIKSAVEQEVAPIRDQVGRMATAYNMPSNLNGSQPVAKNGSDHYMEGFFIQ